MGRRKKAPKKSHSIMVLDRSGSMVSIKKDTEGGFDTLIESLRDEGAEAFVTLVQFDTVHDTVYEQKELDKVPKLKLVPRGATALLDGVGEAIRRAEKFVRKGDNVVVTILTDGGENSSREYSKKSLTKLMDEKRKDGWEFNFIGAGPSAWSGADLLGIGHTHTINYSGSAVDTAKVFRAAALSNVSKMHGGTSSYVATASALKAELEDTSVPDIQLPDAQVDFATPRRRGSGKNLK